MKLTSLSSLSSIVLALLVSSAGAQVTIIQTTARIQSLVGVHSDPAQADLTDIKTKQPPNGFISYNDSVSAHAERDNIHGDALTRQNTLVNAGTFDLLVSSSGETSLRLQPVGNTDPPVGSYGRGQVSFRLDFNLIQRSRISLNGSVSAIGPDPGASEPFPAEVGTFEMRGGSNIIARGDTRTRRGTERTVSFSKTGFLEQGSYTIEAALGGNGSSIASIRSSYTFVLQLAPAPIAASEVTWRSPANGDFSDATHWDPQTVPNSADVALFTPSGTYTVNVGAAASDRAVINRSRVTFANADYTLGAISPLDPSLTVEHGGSLTLDGGTLRAVHARVASDFNSSGTSSFTIRNPGTHFQTSGILNIGGIGSGGLFSVQTGATATTATTTLGGIEQSSARVDGAGASWNTGNFQIQGFDTQLFVFHGGHLTSGNVMVQAATQPLLRVQDVGTNAESSRWDMQGFANDDAELLILDGGYVTASSIQLGQRSYRTGSVIVSGVNQAQNRPSQLDVATSISVGGLGKGLLSIKDGAFVSTLGDVVIAGLPDIATNNPGRGDIVVDGGNAATIKFSELQIEGKLEVGTGPNGVGQLVISNGGRVECASARVGVANRAGGAIVHTTAATGGTSLLSVEGNLTVGLAGSTGVVALIDSTVIVGGDINVSSSGALTGTGHVEAFGTITVNSGGFISPGLSPGILTLKGHLVVEAGAVIHSEVAGPAPGTQADQLIVTGDATLDGTLKLQFMNGYAPKAGDAFQFFKVSGTTTGDFASIDVVGLAPGAQFQTTLSNGIYTATAMNDTAALSTVSIKAVTKKAFEKGKRSVVLLVSRKGSKASKASALTVNCTVSGSAENGIDYTFLPGSVTIPAHKNAVTIKLKPIDDVEFEGSETVEFKVIPGADYTNSLKSKAQVAIVDNERAGH